MKHITIFNSVALAEACPGLYTPLVCMVEGLSGGLVFAKNNGVEGEQIKIDVDPSGKVVPVYQNPDFVDLGLPSGRLWCKHNLGATCLDTSTSWYGNYYAWGEVEPKNNYEWNTYAYGGYDELTKYCPSDKSECWAGEGKPDGKTGLDLEDDAVVVNEGQGQMMPTKEECEELLSNTDSEWVEDYNDVEGLNGRLFTSKINGNQLFIPATGYVDETLLTDDGSFCYLWSSSLSVDDPNVDDPNSAWFLDFDSDYIGMSSIYRHYGMPIHAVL